MKKVMLGLVMVVMLMSMVGCGETKKEGFVPEQVTESEVVTDNAKENIEEVIDTENLQKYYDTEKFLGTPYLVLCDSCGGPEKGTLDLTGFTEVFNVELQDYERDSVTFIIEKTDTLEYFKKYYVIGCDNNTPDDLSDDVIAYIFTTPITEQ